MAVGADVVDGLQWAAAMGVSWLKVLRRKWRRRMRFSALYGKEPRTLPGH